MGQDQDQGYWFFRVPIAPLEDEVLSAIAKSVYFALCRYAGATGTCFPGYKAISRISGIRSTVTIRKGVRELVSRGYIECTPRREKGQSNIYRILHLTDQKGTVKHEGKGRRVAYGK